jgi:D-xylonolactonase
MQAEMIADYACVCGEGPLWHPTERRLYWTDIDRGRLFWYDPATGHHEPCYQGPKVGGFTIQADSKLLLFREKGNVVTFQDGRIVDTVVDQLPQEEGFRYNDVIADPRGRVFCGTLGKAPGRLYRMDVDGAMEVVVEGTGCANGMGFTRDRRTMYFTDSGKRIIWRFAYDEESGRISDQTAWVTVPRAEGEGCPDGMTLDDQERIWSARWDGSGVVCHASDGSIIRKVDVPAKKASCVTFGGDDLSDMYITTAGGDKKDTDGPLAGALVRIRGVARGVPEFRSRIGL